MKRHPPGRYEETATAGERVRAFIPPPLPPNPPVDISGARRRLHDRALLACGRLDGINALLPEHDLLLYLYAYVRREAVLSSQIEGTQSSLSDLLLFEISEAPGVPLDDVREVSNYAAALDHGTQRLADGAPLTNRLLREVHARLLASGRGAERQPGEFRRSQNWIGGTRPGNAHYVPPPPHHVAGCMADLERFLNDAEADPGPLVRAGIAHVQFETIHPFLDGNGRVGRLLIALLLHHEGVLRRPLLYLSLYLKQHRAEYYRLLRDAEQVRGLERAAANALRVFDALRERPVSTIGNLAGRARVSFGTAARAVEALRQLGIADEVTGRSRDRVFAYRAYLAILSEGAEPL